MKNIRLISLISFYLIFLQSFGQTDIIERFSVNENDGKVYLDWVITAGNTCNGIKIHHSTDSIQFNEIGSIEGVCGDLTQSKAYRYVHENPQKNSLNYYWLELGNNGFSEIASIYVIVFEEIQYQVRPNPVTSKANIYFENKSNEAFQLMLFNTNGKHINTFETNDSVFQFDASELSSGTYLFTILKSDNSITINGKFLVIN